MGMIKTFEGLNSEHMLDPPKPRRKIIKYSDGKGNYYTLVDGENMVTMSFPDISINDEGFERHFLNNKMITMEEFIKKEGSQFHGLATKEEKDGR